MELLALLREGEKERKARARVIIVSAYATPQHVREAFKIHNVFDYVDKHSFEKKGYVETVNQAVSESPAERS